MRRKRGKEQSIDDVGLGIFSMEESRNAGKPLKCGVSLISIGLARIYPNRQKEDANHHKQANPQRNLHIYKSGSSRKRQLSGSEPSVLTFRNETSAHVFHICQSGQAYHVDLEQFIGLRDQAVESLERWSDFF